MTTAQSDYAARVRAAGAAYLPLTAMHRQAKTWLIRFKGVNYTGASWRGQVRSRPDAPGAALATLTFVATLDGPDTVLAATLSAVANSGLPAAAEPGAASLTFYDIAITPVGGTEQTILAGELYRTGSNLV